MAAKVLPDQAYLRECFDYRPDIGLLVWRSRPNSHFQCTANATTWNKRFTGKIAGKVAKGGRAVVTLNNRLFKAARVIWKLHEGTEPPEIDHRDNDLSNDRIENLRPATRAENMRNRRMDHNNQCGIKGVARIPKSGRYVAHICVDGKSRHLGCFSTPEEAAAAYEAAARRHFGEFAYGG